MPHKGPKVIQTTIDHICQCPHFTHGYSPYNNYAKIEDVPDIAQVGARMERKAIRDDSHHTLCCEDHQKNVLNPLL